MEPIQNINACNKRAFNPEEEEEGQKEAMFEKALTPSDVGKLNRLVIPKQHAEKYFPLGGGGAGGDTKGVLLSFEDESGKFWRFRYSYWNSSQSYVLTKGWSRYVKDKRLYAGDVVSFHRHLTDTHRLFICWRRRHPHAGPPVTRVGHGAVGVGWTTPTPFYSVHTYPEPQLLSHQPQTLPAPGSGLPAQRTVVGNGSSKVLRLFGVNMECQVEADESGPSTSHNSSNVSSSSTPNHFYHYDYPHLSYASIPQPHMVRQQSYF